MSAYCGNQFRYCDNSRDCLLEFVDCWGIDMTQFAQQPGRSDGLLLATPVVVCGREFWVMRFRHKLEYDFCCINIFC